LPLTYEQLKEVSPEEFKRFTGVQRPTFEKMGAALGERERDKKKRGRPAKLTVAAQVLVALQYWREYRPYFPIAVSWQLSEAAVGRITHRVEEILINVPQFHLPGKKKLREGSTQFEVVVVDATESPMEHPQKTSATTIVARSAAHRATTTECLGDRGYQGLQKRHA
jgi:hypothetical protein